MAKKKLNKVAAAAIATVLVIGAGLGGTYFVYLKRVRPAQNRAEGRELMLKGEYDKAYLKFGRAAYRYPTDIEFLGWLYETIDHQTSFDDDKLRLSVRELEQMLTVKASDVPTLQKRVKVDLDLADYGFDSPDADRLGERAKAILAKEPTDPTALRALAMAKAIPLFQQQGLLSSTDIDAVTTDLRTMVDAAPLNGDLLFYYAAAQIRHRQAMVADKAIAEGPDSDVAKALLVDLDARVAALIAKAGDAQVPADQRAQMFRSAGQIDQMMLQNRIVPTRERAEAMNTRRIESLNQSSALVPPESPNYITDRLMYAGALRDMNKLADAEKVLRDTVAAAPKVWRPRLELAEMLNDTGRSAEAVEVLSAELKPDFSLAGVQGYAFLHDSMMVPLRRSLFRLQSLDKLPAGQRQAEIAKAQSDYDKAIAGKVSETDVPALQTKSALQEVRQDRAAAVETLRRALDSNPGEAQRTAMMQHVVDLNVAMNQPGAAADMLEKLVNAAPSPQNILQLIDLRIRNNEPDAAKTLIAELKRRMPDNPAVAAAELKLITDPTQRKAAFDKIPEDSAAGAQVKFRLAVEGGDDDLAQAIADRYLAKNAGDIGMTALDIDLLIKRNQRPAALKLIDAAIAVHPDQQVLKTIRDRVNATTAEEVTKVVGGSIKDPYQRALFEAEQLHGQGAPDEQYIAKLKEAMAADKENEGSAVERLFLFYLSRDQADNAEPLLDPMSKSHLDPGTVRAHRARLAVSRGQADEALKQADALVADLPNFAAAWIVKGEAHQIKQQYDQAANAFDAALANQPNNIEALHGAIENASRLARSDQLKRYIDTGIKASNNDPWFVDQSLRYQLQFGDPTATIDPRVKARDASPKDPNKWLALAQSYAASANAKLAVNDKATADKYRKQALDVLSEAMKQFPEVPGFPLQAADLTVQSGDPAGAVKILDAMDATPAFANDPQVQLVRSEMYFNTNQVDHGRKVLEGIVAANKGGDDARVRLATVQAATGDPTGALATLDAAPNKSDRIGEAKFNLLLSTGKIDDAAKLANDALAKDRTVSHLLMAGIAEARRNNVPGALKLADEAVNEAPDDANAHLTRAKIALGEKDVRNNDILADLQAARKAAPNNAETRLLIVGRLQAINHSSEALTELESLQRDQPGNKTAVMQLIEMYLAERPVRSKRIDSVLADAKKAGLVSDSQLLSQESRFAMQTGDLARGVDAAQKAAQADPNNLDLFRDFLTTLVKAGAYDKVLAELDRIEKINPSLYWTYSTRGVALHRMKRDPDAAKQFGRAMSIATSLKDNAPTVGEIAQIYAGEYGADATADWLQQVLPGDADAQALALSLYVREGKYPKAIELSKTVMAALDRISETRQVMVLTDLATAYLAMTPANPQRAREAYEKLLTIHPDDVMTLNNLAYAMTLDGSKEAMDKATIVAKKAFDISMQSDPNPYVMDTYGWTLVQAGGAGDVEKGLEVLRQAQGIKQLPEISYHIGAALIIQGQKDDAKQSLQNALDMIQKLEDNKEAVDASLKPRIKASLEQAQ